MPDSPAVKYSVIVPVYNRVDEVRDLLHSLSQQTMRNFETILVEDGSTVPCDTVASQFPEANVRYFYKENEGRSIARNYGMERAQGRYFIFFDSDCVIPPEYFETLDRDLALRRLDCFGGPDAAHESFSDVQKAINYSMTSFLTTGGIRGGKVQLEKFTPRTFNMGFTRQVWESVGGFREMFSEDIDMSTRIKNAGFEIGLIRDAKVWHKRRVDFKKFWRQVHVFGMSRITLKLLYPDSLKLVHTLPALFVIGCAAMAALAVALSPLWLLPLAAYLAAVFVMAWISNKSVRIACLAVPASIIQLVGYGTGFIRAYVTKIVLGKGRDVNQEIEMRRGK